MGLWNALKRLWNWIRNGSGFGIDELARRLGRSADELQSFVPRYRTFTIPKRTKGKRRIFAPEDSLMTLQRRVLRRLLRRLKVHPAATGFEPGQSIVTHARRHVGRAVVVRLDLRDFFPSTRAARIYRYFRKIGWNRPASHLLTRLCTHEGKLPQGAPTSPRLSNLVNFRVDRRLEAMARKVGAVYSRYADDITLSFASNERRPIRYMIRFVRRVVNEEGYRLHGMKKLRIRRRHQQQRVTGLVVNDGINLPRAVRRRLRAVEHHLRTGRPTTMTTEQLAGWRALEQMIDSQRLKPAHAEALAKETALLQGRWVVVAAERQDLAKETAAQAFAGIQWLIDGRCMVLLLGDERVTATYRVNPIKKTKTIDLTPTSGPERGRRLQGIYDWHDGSLRICMNQGNGKRPTEFAVPVDSHWTLLTLTRGTEAS